MDSRNDEYFDEETGEVMSPRENNMAASDCADESITNQNTVDKNGNSTQNSALKSAKGVLDGSEMPLDDNVNNVNEENTVFNENLHVDADAEADGGSRSSASCKRMTPVDSGGARHFRVTKSSPSDNSSPCGGPVTPKVPFSSPADDSSPCGGPVKPKVPFSSPSDVSSPCGGPAKPKVAFSSLADDSSPCGGPVKPKVPFSSPADDSSPCGGPVKPKVTFSTNIREKDHDSANAVESSNGSCTSSEGARSLPAMDVDHCEQTPRSPNIIHVSDSDYSEDVLIQYGVDPYKWMYPKDLARPEKPQSPVPFHNDSDLTDSEILTQFCSKTGSAQSKPRRTGPSPGHSEAPETQTGQHVVPSGQSAARPGQPRKVMIKETHERFRVPPKLKSSEESCGNESDKKKYEVNTCIGRLGGKGHHLPAGPRAGMIRAESTGESEVSVRRAGMIRTESGESETGEGKNRKTMGDGESNNGTTSKAEGGAECWNWSDSDMEKQYSEYIKNMGTSTDQFVQTDDASGEDNASCKCTCPQCGHEMKLYEETQDKTSPQAGEKSQDKEDVCSCDHSDKGPDWHAVFMYKLFKMHSFMMAGRGGRHPSPFHNANQGAQRPPFPPPPWMRPPWFSWRAGPPGPRGPSGPSGACQGGPWQRFCAPWACPPGTGDNSPHGRDKPHDVPETGAC